MSIELKRVDFVYPDGFAANRDLNLTIRPGERLAIVGQNGAGKTTAVKLMNGLHKPTGGDVLVDGQNTKEHTTAQIARTVGYVFQNPDDQIFNQTVRAEIEYMPRYFKLPQAEIERRTERAVALTGLAPYLKKNPFDIPYPIRKFVTIAAVLVTEPKYVIFDEPTAGQDRRGTLLLENILEQLQAEGVAVVTITHDMEFVARNFGRLCPANLRQRGHCGRSPAAPPPAERAGRPPGRGREYPFRQRADCGAGLRLRQAPDTGMRRRA